MPQHDRTTPALALSGKALRTTEQPISYLISAAMANPDLINLAAGLVDPATLPVDATAKIAARILAEPVRARAALQYDTTLGLAALRRTLLGHLEALEGKSAADLGLTADHLMITTGSQQALYLIGDVLLDPGDIVIAENPSYFVYTGTLASLGARVLPVPIDDGGMDVDAVDRLLASLGEAGQLHRVKLIYCMSYYQNPTGLSLSAERRPKLLEVARKYSRQHRILILEDAAYRELRYDGAGLPSIKSFDTENRYTALAQTFSKPFAPGLKTGYAALPSDLLQAVLNQKGNHDFGSGSLAQHIALEALRDGSYHEHVNHLRSSYRTKRDTMLAALRQHMPEHPGIAWTHPHGGLYVWVTLPESIDTSRDAALFTDAVKNGVLYVPGDYAHQPDPDTGAIPRNTLRLSFGQVAPEQIGAGIERLAEVIASQLRADAPAPATQAVQP